VPPPPALADLVERCAAPTAVRAALDRLAEAQPELSGRLGDDPGLAGSLVAVLAASRSLTRLVESDDAALEVLADLDRRPPPDGASVDRLRRWKRLELLRIAARDLTRADDLTSTTALLSRLAADVLDVACLMEGADGLAVIGMGKLGGDELNYASDVDVMFVGDGPADALERRARAVMDTARQCFRIDPNLRPEGRNGALVRSLDGYEAYWHRWAQPWEFQALLKARPKVGALFADTAERWLWNRPFSADDLRSVRAMKERTEDAVSRKGVGDREIKRSRGGIRDIEFTVQLLQLVHGQLDPGLRSPNTLDSLVELADAGYVDPVDASQLAEAYGFLREVEHRIQLVDEQQSHTVPSDDASLTHLSRVLRFKDRPEGTSGEQFLKELRRQRAAVRSIHERVYFRPLLEAFAQTDAALSPEAVETRLAAFGFTDAMRTKAAVKELTRGLNRRSRLMQQFLPLILNWLSDTPDPDLGLLQLRNLLDGPRAALLVDAFRDSPEACRRLCLLLGTSRLVGERIARNPDLVARLPHPGQLRTQARDDLVASATAASAWRADPDERQAALRRWSERHQAGVTARDLLGLADEQVVGANLAAIAEAVLEVSLASLEPRLPFAVVGLGRLGGAALSYASDLDVVFVYDGEGAADAAEAARVAQGLLRAVGGPAGTGIWELDVDLRPEGKQGPTARSLAGFEAYFQRWALVWERQAFSRARFVAGDATLGDRLLGALEPHVWGMGLSDEDVREIRRLKARVERERIPANEDPQFHLKLGRGSLSDIEFTAQLLQLRHGVRAPATLTALDRLEAAGHLATGDASVLREAYRFCEATRNRLFLVNSAPGNSLPTQPEQLAWLARSLGTNPAELREHYRRVTRRSRRVVERVFYGRSGP
jgi:[glutamine synthetase] adenylyltransferase / [glutamine synthetase]-adenylyl-L-tyrosine phosphorylase